MNTFQITCPALLEDCAEQHQQTLNVPDVFREHLLPMLAGMEWAAIFDQRGDPAAAAGELRAAATAAEDLAEQLRKLRDRADQMAESGRTHYVVT